jgi:hypothetical protein
MRFNDALRLASDDPEPEALSRTLVVSQEQASTQFCEIAGLHNSAFGHSLGKSDYGRLTGLSDWFYRELDVPLRTHI